MNTLASPSDVSSLEASLNIPQEMQKEILRLEVLISTTLANLHIMNQSILETQTELKVFLADYMQEVGAHLDELEAIRQEIAQLDGRSYKAKYYVKTDHLTQPMSVEKDDNEVKKLYDKLMHECVPDAHSAQHAKERFFNLLTESYQKNDIKTLTTIEHMFTELKEFQGESQEAKLYRLSQKYDMVLQAYKQACKKKVYIEVSAVYQLKNRVLQEKIKGKDHIAAIKQHLRRRLYDENKNLLRKQQDKILGKAKLAATLNT